MDVDVVIVGAGPTGLTLANMLGAQGLTVEVLEMTREEDTLQFPRAVGLDHDALRTFQAVGLVDRMLPDIIQNTAVRFFAADRSELVTLKREPQRSPFGWHRRNMFMQHLTDAVLRDGLSRYDTVRVRYQSEVTGLEQDADGVTLTVRSLDTGVTAPVRARFAVGADGARSTLRKLLGLRLDGDTYEEPWLILEVDEDPWDAPYSSFFCDPARPVYSGQLPRRHRRWGLMLQPDERDEDVLAPEGLRRLLSPLVPSFDDLNVISARVYRHQARMVKRLVNGRAVLVGDAAHLMPPWAGQGLNSGLRDVTSLAWRLTLMVRGLAGPELLESFDAERRPHARTVIDLSRRFGKIFIPRDPKKVLLRDVALKTIKRIPVLRERFYRWWFNAPLRYDAVVAGDGRRVHPDVGTMFIQPEVEAATGTRLLDDVLGTGFAVVSFRCDPAEQLSDQDLAFWKDLGARFVRVELSRTGALVAAEPGTVVEDLYGLLEQWFARNRGSVAVVRPDRCVAAVCDVQGLGRVTQELAGILRPS